MYKRTLLSALLVACFAVVPISVFGADPIEKSKSEKIVTPKGDIKGQGTCGEEMMPAEAMASPKADETASRFNFGIYYGRPYYYRPYYNYYPYRYDYYNYYTQPYYRPYYYGW